jgi:hypothetical protein
MNKIIKFKLKFLLKNIRKDLNINEYNEITKILCNKKKINSFKVFLKDLNLYLTNLKLIEYSEINLKKIKICLLSLYICNEPFFKVIFNNNTEYNKKIKELSSSIVNLIINFEKKNDTLALYKIMLLFNEFLSIYKKWEVLDKRINTLKLLCDYFEIKEKMLSLGNEHIIYHTYLNELKKIENNVKFLNDKNELNYFNLKKKNVDNYQKSQEELYWIQIKYNISCEEKYKDTLIELIKKTKSMFIECVPNNLVIQNEIQDCLDINILNNMLTKTNNDEIDFEYLEGKIFYILDVLKRFQAQSDDESYKIWCNDIETKLKTKIYYKDFIPYFFRELFIRLKKILEAIKKFKENIFI